MAPKRERPRANPSLLVLALHVPLAAFVSFRSCPATQDGPAHLYGAHILRSLAEDAASPFRPFFAANLHPIGNSLYTYGALALARQLGEAHEDYSIRISVFLALLGMPLAALGFERALAPGRGAVAERHPSLAVALACVLSYNYFLYRGFFNYTLSVPLAMASVAAVLAVGRTPSPARSVSFALLGVASALLASLAHPAALVFLLAAVPAACWAPGRERRVVGAVVCAVLLYFGVASRVRSDTPPAPDFSNPLQSLMQFVRALGISYSWLEVVPAVTVLLACLLGVWRALRGGDREPSEPAARFPLWLAGLLALAFFFVPYGYGGVQGLNERIPLFVILLVAPYASLPNQLRRWLPLAFVPFALYTIAARVRFDALADQVRSSAAADVIPRHSVVSLATLRVKNGALSVDLGRHALADLARRRELVAGSVFCGHPAHVLACKERAPLMPSLDGVQAFEHLSAEQQRAALANPDSSIRRSLSSMREQAARAPYLLVLHAPALDAAFEREVLSPLGAELLAGAGEPVRAYRIPQSALAHAGQARSAG